jgi:hypothetical protein
LNNLLYEHQYGFQKNRSTEHNLTHLTNYIFSAINDKKFCIGLFLDLKKAFDVCSHQILLKKLPKYGINGLSLQWFASYLKDRQQKVDVEGVTSSTNTFNISVIQGSILGPILFLIYINDLYSASKLLKLMFADDTAGLASDKNLSTLVENVNAELKKIARWFRSNKMAVNVSKTKFIIFHTKGRVVDNNIQLIYDDNEPNENNPALIKPIERIHSNHQVKSSRSYKLLGIHLDENLTFDYHTQSTITKLNRSLYCISKTKNFLPKPALKSLYYALIHSHLTYCPIITSCATAKNIKKISQLQKKAIRIISGKQYHAHTNPIFKELRILPYTSHIRYAKLLFMHSVVNKYSPKSFYNTWQTNMNREPTHNLRNQDDIPLPHPRIELFKRSPLYTLPYEWNKLGGDRFQQNKTTFRIAIKNTIFEEIPN